MVEQGKSFNIIGGYTGKRRTYSDKIYKYDTSGGQWVKLPTTLSEVKTSVTAIRVKSSFFPEGCRPGKFPTESD